MGEDRKTRDARKGDNMKLVYIAGAFTGANNWEIQKNVRKAETVALAVWRSGAVAVCPHKNTQNFYGAIDEKKVVEGYITLLEVCHAIVVLPGSANSNGTIIEMDAAYKKDMPLFFLDFVSDDPEHLPRYYLEWLYSPDAEE